MKRKLYKKISKTPCEAPYKSYNNQQKATKTHNINKTDKSR